MQPAAYNVMRDKSLAGAGNLNTNLPKEVHQQAEVVAGAHDTPRAPQLLITDSFVREPECRQITGLSRVTRWRLEREGKFPRRRRLSSGAIGWLRSEIAHWVVTRTA